MPKRVDHDQRRQQIAAALLRVAGRHGLEEVSLRHVAAEAGVTSGMVQHYFPTKDAMMHFAMESASTRFENRMTGAIAELGDEPAPRELVGVLLRTLLPLNEPERVDARVALAFLSYAATRSAAADGLTHGNSQLREFIAEQIRLAQSAGDTAAGIDPRHAATALFAMADGLGIHLLSTGLQADTAIAALDAQLDLTFTPTGR